MTTMFKLSGREYYDSIPKTGLEVGDIWCDLPTFGNLSREYVQGVVITPSCDLSNCKVPTITFVPVVSVREYLASRAFAIEYIRVIRAQAPNIGIALDSQWELPGTRLPSLNAVKVLANDVAAFRECNSMRLSNIPERLAAGLQILDAILHATRLDQSRLVPLALGAKEYARTVDRIITNSYSQDIHFLPKYKVATDQPIIENHSVALFRYPTTLPIEILNSANDIDVKNWRDTVDRMQESLPIARHMRDKRPLKVATIRSKFMNDLIARFVALHVRMGSPDFTKDTIDTFSSDIRGCP